MEATPRRQFLRSELRPIVRPAPKVQQASTSGKKEIVYYKQLLDVWTICSNALRELRESNTNDRWTKETVDDDWMYKFDVPVKPTF